MKMKKLLGTALLAVFIVPTFSQAAEVTYEEQNSNANMAESFTGSAKVVYGQTPSFTVKIPKNIDLDGEGLGKYTVGVKGKIPSKYAVIVVPDETITMEEENGLLDDITADVTPEKITWIATELAEDTYNESTNNTIQMQSIDFAKFRGTLNFNVSAEIPTVELKDASKEVKGANHFIGETSIDALSALSGASMCIPDSVLNVSTGDIVYIVGGKRTVNIGYEMTFTLSTGYYKCTKGTAYLGGSSGLQVVALHNSELLDVEYLGESYPV